MDVHPDIGLVLEGGGMRGVFTSGVLDFLLDRDIRFKYAVAVSAGACNGLSYVSRQRGRARRSNIDMFEEHPYIGLRYLWTQHSILDRDFLYRQLPDEVLPYDYDTCFANPMTFEMVTTNCLTGRACYLSEHKDPGRLLQIAKASSSLPYVCPVVWVDHTPMLDGGIIDSIPIDRAISTGHSRNIVVLTRNRGYRPTASDIKVPHYIYTEFPRLRVLLSHRHAYYRRQLDRVEQLEDEEKIVVVRPERPMAVGRFGSDTRKLSALYDEGYECARKLLDKWDGGFEIFG